MVRIISAVVMGALLVGAIWWLPAGIFKILIVVMAFLGLSEYSQMFFKDPREQWAVIIAGTLAAATMLFCPAGFEAVLFFVVLILFAMSLLFMWTATRLEGIAERLGLSILGVVYLGVAFPFWGPLRGLSLGKELVFLAIVPACLCDTFAYIVGKSFGKMRLAPKVSPNKTVEGFFGALLGSLVGTFLVRAIMFRELSWHMAIVFALMIWIVSPVGDLIESLLKRSSGVKDSGSVIPGHGGVLDRLDALVFTGPAAYVFAKYVIGV